MPVRNRFPLWLAQGAGLGRLPAAPGTWGSLAGLVWFLALVATGHLAIYLAGTLLGILLSAWACGCAERTLRTTDPKCVVLDEIVAMPVCCLAWLGWHLIDQGRFPELTHFFHFTTGLGLLLVFLAFRVLDIAKPWPVHRVERISGGWGITLDDLAAAVYVNLLILVAAAGKALATGE